MRSFLTNTLKALRDCSSGNAMLMTALGMPVLIGATGYGVDTAQWYMWQRELQHAVDQAAIGGAWALVNSPTADYAARARQEYLGNQSTFTANYDSADGPTVKLANYNNGTNNSVLVTATVTRKLPFTGFLLNNPVTVTARAQAAFTSGAEYHACLYALSTEKKTTFDVGGSATVIANCGIGAMSCSGNVSGEKPAIVIDGSAKVETTSIATCGTASVPPANVSALKTGIDPSAMEDEYSETPIPQPDASTPKRTYECSTGKDKVATPLPGIYKDGITAKCQTTFAPGIYFIDGGTLDLSTNDPVVGLNVMFILRKGATLKLGGEGGTGNVTLTPMQEADFIGTPYAANSGLLAQKLILEDKTGVTGQVDHKINGNSDMRLEGVLYLPNGNVTINGTSDSVSDLCFQISAWTLTVKGNAYLKTLCDYDESTTIGTEATGVRLIA